MKTSSHVMFKSLSVAFAALLAAACGGKSSPSTGTAPEPVATAAADAAVQEGGGWKRSAPGVWIYDPGFDKPSEVDLVAPPPGRGIERLELPAGATGAKLATVSAGMTKGGEFTWTAYAAAGAGAEVGAQLASGDGTAAPADTLTWIDTPLGDAAVTGPFLVAFTTRSGTPAVGATRGDPGNVYFQPALDAPAQQTPFAAFVKVTLTDVH